MRIAFVSRELYPYAGGGIAPIVAAAARHLAEVAEVTVFTSAAHRPEHERLVVAGDARLLPANVSLVWVPEPGDAGCGAYFSYMHAYSARAHAALRDTYGNRGPDLIEFCDYLGEGFVTVQARHTAAAWLEQTQVCVRLHTTAEIVNVLNAHMAHDFATVATFEAERYVLRHADRVLWSGGDVYDTYQRFYGALAPGARIPDAFLAEVAAEEDTGLLPEDGEPLRLLYLGRLERRKGVQNLLRSVTSLLRDDWTLTLLGGDTVTGPMAGSVRAQLELMAAGDPRINFVSGVPRPEVESHLRGAHMVVIPSLWECWPNTAREAMMLNRPLLTTRVGGLSELAQPGRSGWHVSDTTPEALAEAIEERLDDREGIRRLITDGRPRDVFDELTDPEALVSRYTSLATGRSRRKPAPHRTSQPLVSVVVPYFKLERTVAATLRSVLAQTHEAVEVLLVVDGSLREEDEAVFDLADRLGVRVITQVNSGLGAARNFGIGQCRGTYVLPLDADDVIDPAFIHRCVDALERDPDLAYVTTWVSYMGPDGELTSDEDGGYMPYGNWSRLIKRNNVAGTCSAVFRRSVFDEGFDYSPDLTSYEDWLLYLELHHAGHHGAVIPERLFHYRVRADSMMREIGAPSLQRLAGEVHALQRERSMRWVADGSQGVASTGEKVL